MKRLIYLILILVSCHSQNSNSEILPNNFEGKVTAIKDGDTYKIMCNGKERTVRLEHIDCPEKRQPFGTKAKQFASDLCFGRIAKVISKGKIDRYKRLIAEIYINGVCVNKELVKNGFAWHYVKYSNNETYASLEKNAKLNSVGLWADLKPIEPWNWRKRKAVH